jgi:hypothetical protein
MKRIASVEDHKLNLAYDALRETLLRPKFADRIDKPLAFWALAGDRRLPMALLGFSLKQLLASPLDDLAATPGIGKKKLGSLIKLLNRATKDQPPAVPLVDDDSATPRAKRAPPRPPHARFDPLMISEALWEQWQRTVRDYGLAHESLGRLAPSLQNLPTVIWRTPLDKYLDLTVAEMRRLKTHGEKRVRAILEVFHSVHEMLAHVPNHGHLRIDVRPKFTVPIEHWIEEALARSAPPNTTELRQRVVVPIVEQLKIDAGPAIHRLVEERLGIKTPPQRVQQQAKRLGVTRARVYQLLETCADVMSVRWPEGEELFARLDRKLAAANAAKPQTQQLRELLDLIYPKVIDESKQRAAKVGERTHPRSEGTRAPHFPLERGHGRPKSNGTAHKVLGART